MTDLHRSLGQHETSDMTDSSKQLNELIQRAQDWTRYETSIEGQGERYKEMSELINESDLQRLNERFGGRLHFGTAGLRGEIGSGPQRMNLALIRWVSVGLAHYLRSQSELNTKRIVIGYDGRYRSDSPEAPLSLRRRF